jgi:hypothetical protein
MPLKALEQGAIDSAIGARGARQLYWPERGSGKPMGIAARTFEALLSALCGELSLDI